MPYFHSFQQPPLPKQFAEQHLFAPDRAPDPITKHAARHAGTLLPYSRLAPTSARACILLHGTVPARSRSTCRFPHLCRTATTPPAHLHLCASDANAHTHKLHTLTPPLPLLNEKMPVLDRADIFAGHYAKARRRIAPSPAPRLLYGHPVHSTMPGACLARYPALSADTPVARLPPYDDTFHDRTSDYSMPDTRMGVLSCG